MASGDTLVNIPAQDFVSIGPNNAQPYALVQNGVLAGLPLLAGTASALYAAKRLPGNASLSTGATVKLLISDDPNNSCAGKAVKLGVNFGKLGTTSTYVAPADAALGTEATATVTMPSTSGQTIEVSIPIVVANMASAAANTWVECRIRRLGADSADTGTNGVVLLYNATVLDT